MLTPRAGPSHAALLPVETEGSRGTATVGGAPRLDSAHMRGISVRSILNNFELRQRVRPGTRARVRSVVERFGEATSRHRPLPDFLILGAQKAGTTALYQSLCRHPGVSAAFTKEVHYFDLQPDRSDRWYRGHFPRRPQRAGSSKRFLTGEATPYYLFHPSVPERVAEKVPDAKLIVLLRDPVRRAISHFYHELSLGYESRSFLRAIKEEPHVLEIEAQRIRQGLPPSYEHQHHTYVSRGVYAEQLERWMGWFSREQVLVVPAEGLHGDGGQTFGRVLSFLELDAVRPAPTRKAHQRAYPQPDDTVLDELRSRFREPNVELREWLGPEAESFPWLHQT